MQNTGLVLEGGGMRGLYTAGVLRYLMEQDIYIPYTIGVSAGACNGSSYIARQIDRNYSANIEYVSHPEYISYKRFLKKRELFGMDFIFDKIPNELVPFDMKAFCEAKEKFVVGVTDCLTGEPIYYSKEHQTKDIITILRASSSIPFFAPEISYDGRMLLDGGIADPIPIQKSEADGNTKNIVVLTGNKGYMKGSSFNWFAKRKYKNYEGLLKALRDRHILYNDTVRYLEEQEEKGNVVLIRPIERSDVSRIERNPEKLKKLYNQGYAEAKAAYGKIKKLL
jgi:predicted patatin/cPLA2 family phospholipase